MAQEPSTSVVAAPPPPPAAAKPPAPPASPHPGDRDEARLAVPRVSFNSMMARCGTCKLATDVAAMSAAAATKPRDLDEALGPITFKTCGATNLTKQGDREAPVLKFAAPEAPAGGGAEARAVRRGTGFTLKFRSRAAGL